MFEFIDELDIDEFDIFDIEFAILLAPLPIELAILPAELAIVPAPFAIDEFDIVEFDIVEFDIVEFIVDEFVIVFILFVLVLVLVFAVSPQAIPNDPKTKTPERAIIFFILFKVSCLLQRLSIILTRLRSIHSLAPNYLTMEHWTI